MSFDPVSIPKRRFKIFLSQNFSEQLDGNHATQADTIDQVQLVKKEVKDGLSVRFPLDTNYTCEVDKHTDPL